MNTQHTSIQLVVDECPDAHGFLTLRLADGTPNGDTTYAPVATVYQDHNAAHIVRCVNDYDTMLTALKLATEALQDAATFADAPEGYWDEGGDGYIANEAVQAVLAKKEG